MWDGHQQDNLRLSIEDKVARLEQANDNLQDVYWKKYT